MPWNNGIETFLAGEDLEAKRRVKIETGTENDPPEVVYADAGEDFIGVTEYAVSNGDNIAVKLCNCPGIFEIECDVNSAIARGTVLYGADDGKVSDDSSGTAQGISLEVGADDQHLKVALWNVKSTTAATVSIDDSSGFTSTATVEAALAEIYRDLLSAQAFIPLPLTQWREVGTNDIQNLAGHGGILAKDSTPILEYTDGDTDSALRLNWEASVVTGIVTEIPLPPDLDTSEDLVLHFRAAMTGATDTPTVASDAYFNEGDTKVEDASAAVSGDTYAEKTITIAAADVPSGAQTLTIELTPGTHDNSGLYATGFWLEYTRSIRTS